MCHLYNAPTFRWNVFQEPVLLSAAWDNGRSGSGSTVARHEWKGLCKTPGALEDMLERQRLERSDKNRMRVPGAFGDEDF